ncbi:MAG: hypothetical protein HQK83_15785 [Fibrobacteria bacterium]|nr:hypothetical protein [Fibrobacteria bacterium]
MNSKNTNHLHWGNIDYRFKHEQLIAQYLKYLSLFLLIAILPCMAATLQDAHLVGPANTSGLTQAQGWVDVAADGTIHVIFAGTKYRTGSAPDKLGNTETFTSDSEVWNARMKLDYQGVPHIVYQKSIASGAKTCFYTTKKDGKWITPEKFADADELGKTRAYYPSIAVDSAGNVLVAFWTGDSDKSSNNVPHYRWRSPSGSWGSDKSIPRSSWKSSPKVKELNGGFYILYMSVSEETCIAGPVEAGGTFSDDVCTEGTNQVGSVNEGNDFTIASDSTIVIIGNARVGFEGPSGLWAATKSGATFETPVYLGDFLNSGKIEGDMHPDVMIDKATGAVVAIAQDGEDKTSYFFVYENDSWSKGKAISNESGEQTCFRTGPSIADMPGPGVIICFRSGNNLYIRELVTEGTLNLDNSVFFQQNTGSYSQLGMLATGTGLSFRFPEKGNFDLIISDLNGKIIASYRNINASTFTHAMVDFETGLHIISFKKLVE